MHAVIKRIPRKGGGDYEYLHLYESAREGKKVRKKFIASFGRLDGREPSELVAAAEAVLRFAQKWAGQEPDESPLGGEDPRRFGDVAALRSVWRSLGLDRIFKRLGKGRKFDFSLESALFAMVAQRLLEPGSKLACVRWLESDVFWPSAVGLDDDDLYSTLTWLDEVKDEAEVSIFERLKQQHSIDDTAFFYDTTTTWFEGRGPEDLAQFGRPKGGQPRDRRLVLVGLIRNREGWPITHRVFPGNTADVSTVTETIDDLADRLGVKKFVFVGDRGMVSREVIEHIESRELKYVLAMRLRTFKRVREQVLGRAGRFQEVSTKLHVKQVYLDEERYVVCRNPESVERDRKRREDIVAALQKKLGPKGCSATSRKAAEIRANRAFRRYLKVDKGRLVVSSRHVKEDGRYDGKWVIRTNLEEGTAAETAEEYKHLGGIERDFRDLKSVIELRPVYHYTEPRVKAHVFVCVLAKLLMVELQRRLDIAGKPYSVVNALKILRKVDVRRFALGDDDRWVRANLTDDVKAVLAALAVPAPALRLPQSRV